ncbi:MAG: RHS repeat-associated core domain-containing protein [Pseudomonadota bacterium]|nr:RHS repeat-associated core domain-containing protein [Pseudomonadota bacterium]
MRKVTVRLGAAGATLSRTDTLYLGDLVISTTTSQPVAAGGAFGAAKVLGRQEEVKIAVQGQCLVIASRETTPQAGARSYRYPLADAQNSILLVADETGAIVACREYFPFGSSSIPDVGWLTDGAAPRYGYQGMEEDGLTGFYNFEHRYYLPWLGRWLTPDPEGPVDRLNLYEYVDNNPATLTGPGGFDPHDNILLYLHLRYMTVAELDEAFDIANAVFKDAYANKNLFTNKAARFSQPLEKKLVAFLGNCIGAFSAANETLATAIENGGGTTGSAANGVDRRPQYKTLRTKVNKTLATEFPEFDFTPEPGQRPFELHHLMYKAQHRELATTTSNFAIATRGSSSSGLIGTHEGVFHLITAGNDASIYTREIAGVIGVIKRMIAGLHKEDINNPKGNRAWLALKKGGNYSKPGGKATTEFRAKSFRIQRSSPRRRELAGKHAPRFIKLKGNPNSPRMKKFADDIKKRRFEALMKKRMGAVAKGFK